jgi:RIO kinase 1
MYDYIKFDPRFPNIKKQRRKTVFAWAQREYRNLLKAREAGIRVPTPINCLYNILTMEYIGDEAPAPKVKDSWPKKPEKFFDEIVKGIRKLYKAGLVHADLSHFNILNYKEKPVFIDMSQATPLDDPNSMTYLERDIKNICNFFKKRGVKAESEEIKQKIMR